MLQAIKHPKKTAIACISCTLLLLLEGCASQKINLEDTTFLTKITDTGLKHFEVALKRASEPVVDSKTAITDKKRRREPRINRRHAYKLLNKVAEEHMFEQGFCRTGFWVLEANFFGPRMTLRGECNEPATEDDRKRFPNTIKRW